MALAVLALCCNASTQALRNLREWVQAEGRENWQSNARIAAIMGSCPKTHKSLVSGIGEIASAHHLQRFLLQACRTGWNIYR